MEALYPGYVSTPVSAYGDSGNGPITMVHDNLGFKGTRIRDWYDGANVVLEHEVIADSATTAFNGQPTSPTTGQYITAVRYVSVFKGVGRYIGEECGLNYRHWLLSSTEGQALLPTKPSDDSGHAGFSGFPFMVSFNEGDLENEVGFTDDVLNEFLELFPALSGDQFPFYSTFYSRFSQQNQKTSQAGGTLEIPDLFDLFIDDAKTAHLATLRTSHKVQLISECEIRRPQEFDQRNKFAGDDWGGDTSADQAGTRHNRSGARVVNSEDKLKQIEESGYSTTHSYNTTHADIIQGSMSYDAGEDVTTVTVDPGSSPGYDPDVRDFWTEYALDTHTRTLDPQHLGQAIGDGGGGGPFVTTFTLLRGSQADMDLRILKFEGDATSEWDDSNATPALNTNLLITYAMGYTVDPGGVKEKKSWLHVLPGYAKVENDQLDDMVQTVMCPTGDSFDATSDPGGGPVWSYYPTHVYGPFPQLLEDLRLQYFLAGTRAKGLAIINSSGKSFICFEDIHSHTPTPNPGGDYSEFRHFQHTPASSEPLVSYRKLLAKIKTDADALQATGEKDTILLEDQGPHDWQVGRTDGHILTDFRLDFVSSAGSWGGSPFFTVAFGDFHHGGMYRSENAYGHIQGGQLSALDLPATWELIHDQVAENMVADWLFSRKLPTIFVTPTVPGQNASSSRGGGQASWTPFYHGTAGINIPGSGSLLLARMIQVSLLWGIPYKGLRLRSLDLVSTTRVTSPADNPAAEGHDMAPWEDGESRPQLFHAVFRNPANPRQVIALFLNEAKSSTRSDAYRFTPTWFSKWIPSSLGAYVVSKYDFSATGSTITTLEEAWEQGAYDFQVALDPGEVVAYVFDFTSGLTFRYRYNDDDYESVPISSSQDRVRVEDIHGSGDRFQYGFHSDLPDEEVEITKVILRKEDLGRSQSK